ncbi:MAG: tetraacyldisaccharide 4'-kinase [Chlamydiales bacterium]
MRRAEVWFRNWVRKNNKRGGNVFLSLPSWFYGACTALRHNLYDRGVFAQKKVDIPVVSIGNLVCGGAGKTQVCLLLAKELKKRIAIVSRGYRGKAEKKKSALLVDHTVHAPDECGDEPWLLASRLPETKVIVCKNRFEGARRAEREGAEVIVLDDGMQHRRLHRDIEIVVIDAADPWGGGYFLPKGLLREDPKRLAFADLVMIIETSPSTIEIPFTQAPSVYGRIVPKRVLDMNGEALGSLEGVSVGVFCGIGNPHRFVTTVESLGAKVVARYFSPDHSAIEKGALKRFARLAKKKGAKLLLCTEKDKIKQPAFHNEIPLPIGWVEASIEIFKNKEAWENLLTHINQLGTIAT